MLSKSFDWLEKNRPFKKYHFFFRHINKLKVPVRAELWKLEVAVSYWKWKRSQQKTTASASILFDVIYAQTNMLKSLISINLLFN